MNGKRPYKHILKNLFHEQATEIGRTPLRHCWPMNVPFKFLCERITDGNGVFWPVIEAEYGIRAVGSAGALLDAYQCHGLIFTPPRSL